MGRCWTGRGAGRERCEKVGTLCQGCQTLPRGHRLHSEARELGSPGPQGHTPAASYRTTALRLLQNLPEQVAGEYILHAIAVSTCGREGLHPGRILFFPFLVTGQETASDALEESSPSSRDAPQATSTGECQNHSNFKKSCLFGNSVFQ